MISAWLAWLAMAAPATLKASDTTALTAEAWGKGAHGVVLVHAEGGSHADWGGFGSRLATQNIASLAVNLRGHGGSSGSAATDADFTAMVQDVSAAAAWLRTKGCATISVIGAGHGGLVGLAAAKTDPGIRDVALLSPKPNSHGLLLRELATGFNRPLLAAAGLDEALAAKSATLVGELVAGPHHLALLDADGSGAKLLNTDADFENVLIAWINGTLVPSGEAGLAPVQPMLAPLESTGTRLEDR